jgi:hypothetical protein
MKGAYKIQETTIFNYEILSFAKTTLSESLTKRSAE